MKTTIALTETTFAAEVLKATGPVLVDLWAPWCGPCQMIALLLDEIAADHGDRFKVTKLNIDEHPHLASQLGVRAVPTLLFFKGGAESDRVVGATPKKTILAKLEALAA
jgi:thioredoxin 1